MKATGIVRRIDDLGRVVIPKAVSYTHLDVYKRQELPYSLLFTTQREEKRLSGRTIMNCHLVISIVLGLSLIHI